MLKLDYMANDKHKIFEEKEKEEEEEKEKKRRG